MGREDKIRLIAYSIWEQESCCDGRDVEHWLRAEAIWEEKQKQEELLSKEAKPGNATAQAKKTKAARKRP